MKYLNLLLMFYIFYHQCAKSQNVIFMYENPDKHILRCWAPHGWEYAGINEKDDEGELTSDTVVSVLINLEQSLRDTIIESYSYTGVDLLVICEKLGYGYDTFVCGTFDGDLIEVNGKPQTGARLLKCLLYYIMVKHLESGRPEKLSSKDVDDILRRYQEWRTLPVYKLPSFPDMYTKAPTWIPTPPPLPKQR